MSDLTNVDSAIHETEVHINNKIAMYTKKKKQLEKSYKEIKKKNKKDARKIELLEKNICKYENDQKIDKK